MDPNDPTVQHIAETNDLNAAYRLGQQLQPGSLNPATPAEYWGLTQQQLDAVVNGMHQKG